MRNRGKIRWGLLFCLCSGLAVGFFMSILAGCGAFSAGSPNVKLQKNVTVNVNAGDCAEEPCACPSGYGDVTVLYYTTSETGVTARIEQQLKDLLKLKVTPR